MDKDKLFHLIQKIITGTASKSEEEQVNENLFDSFSSAEWNEEEMGNKEEIRARILKIAKENLATEESRGKVRPLFIRLGKVAAMVLFLSLIGFYGLRSLTKKDHGSLIFSSQIKPGKEIASLELDNGTILNLGDLQIGEAFEVADFMVVKTKEGNLEYQYPKSSEAETYKEEWNTLRTPKGGEFQIILADGTKVWLNAESSLAFPQRFASSRRKVKVTGEVYFEVSHDKNRPFVVNTKEMDIQVLGTSFNVTAYEDDLSSSVSLVEGSVHVKAGTLSSKLVPGQQARIQNSEIKVDRFDLESETAWKNNYFIFKDKNIKEIMTELARWYDTEIEYQGKGWEDKNYSIRISRRENLEEILSVIELTGTVKFEIQGRRVVVVI